MSEVQILLPRLMMSLASLLESQFTLVPLSSARIMKKDQFLRHYFRSPKHQPPTGLGFFDASYSPASGDLRIDVRFDMIFVNASLQWTQNVQDTFKTEFSSRIPEYWDNKFVIKCTKTGWTDIVAVPKFT